MRLPGIAIFTAVALCSTVPQLTAQEAIRSAVGNASAPASEPYRSPSELKRLSLEQLVAVEITSASRRPEPILQAASAIDVVTGDTIRRFGITRFPDALRLAAGMEVAQVDGHTWAISARGFNISGANKMQVLMDGRSLYTPLFSGVFWDVQRTFMPDVEQIEVIRGPGATLWGANAINGVINIRTRNAKDTQGFVLDGGGGNEEGYAGVRYGGRIGRDTYYRAYVMHQRTDSLHLERGGSAQDDTDITQGGFRIDSALDPDNTLTVQGDAYAGRFGQLNADDVDVDGANILARWTHQTGVDSSISLQSYFDHTHRVIRPTFEEDRETFDLELEGRFVWGQHDIVYGANYRLSADSIANLSPNFAFVPAEETLHLLSGYVQDEWHVIPRKFSVVAGAKLEYNSFSGVEVQPTGRLIWTPTKTQTLWGAVSRAVRTPTRIDQDLVAPNPSGGSGTPILVGNRGFESEELLAYELGYRVQPSETLSADVVAYYHDYDNLRSIEPLDGALVLRNLAVGETYGATVALNWRATEWWRLAGNFSLLQVDVHRGPGSRDPNDARGEWNDPDHFFTIRSSIDLPWNLQFDSAIRYVDELPHPGTPAYLTLDLRLGWAASKNLEVAIVGRNLLDSHHPEFRNTRPALTREVERSVYATLRWTY